jgi:hypothetical protein
VFADQLVGFGETLARSQTHIDNLSAECDGRGALDGRCVRGHDDHSLRADFAGDVGRGLAVVAAGVGDDPAGDLFRGELKDLVGRAADFEGADGLKRLSFQVDFARLAVTAEAGEWGADQRGFDGDVRDAGGGSADFGEGDERFWHRGTPYFEQSAG